jgi:hypothetical protein
VGCFAAHQINDVATKEKQKTFVPSGGSGGKGPVTALVGKRAIEGRKPSFLKKRSKKLLKLGFLRGA